MTNRKNGQSPIDKAIDSAEQQAAHAPGIQTVSMPLRTEPIILNRGQSLTIDPPSNPGQPIMMLRSEDGSWQVVILAPGVKWELRPEGAATPPKIWLPGMPS